MKTFVLDDITTLTDAAKVEEQIYRAWGIYVHLSASNESLYIPWLHAITNFIVYIESRLKTPIMTT